MKTSLLPFRSLTLILSAAALSQAVAVDIQTKALTPIRLEKPAAHAPVVFARDGKPVFDIVLDHSVSRRGLAARTDAVGVLTQACARVFGAVPPVRSADASGSRVRLLVRDSGTDQAFTVASDASGLVISGHALYGAIDFCERFLGVRWYFPGPNGWDAPPVKDLTIDPVRYSDEPYVNRREASRWFVNSSMFGAQAAHYAPYFGVPDGARLIAPFADRMRIGGTLPFAGSHSPNPALLGKACPDKLEIIFHRSPNGKLWYDPANQNGYFNVWDLRFADLLVDCWTRLDADPKAFAPGTFNGCGRDYLTFGICDQGLPTTETNGLENVYGRFFDYLSHKAEKALPGKKLYMLCYADCAEPPTDGRYRLASNVEIMLCAGHMPSKVTIPSSVEHVRKRFEGWSEALGGRPVARLWLYGPGNNLFARAVCPEFVGRIPKTFGKLLGREELFYDYWGSEDMWHYYYAAYVLYKSLWNPELDVDAALNELFDRMYPHAAAELKEFHRLLVDAHVRFGAPAPHFDAHYPLDLVDRLDALLKSAEGKIPADSLEMKRFRLIADYWPAAFDCERNFATYKPPVYVLNRLAGEVKPDGVPDEAFWKGVPAMPLRDPSGSNQKPYNAGTVRAVRDAKGVWISFVAPYGDVSSEKKGLWSNDTLEFLFAPGENKEVLYHLAFDPVGQTYFSKQRLLPIVQPADLLWKPDGVRFRAHRGATCWTAEAYFPYAMFEEPVKPGEKIAFNFVQTSPSSPKVFAGSAMTLGDNHNAPMFGYLKVGD